MLKYKCIQKGLFSLSEFKVLPSARSKNFRAKPKQAGKKEGGWGEGIFARLLTAPKARLGWERLRSLAPSREAKQNIFQFLLEEKRSRAKIEKREKCFALHPASGGGGAAGRVQFFPSKKVRAFSNKGHQIGLRDFLRGEAEVCSPSSRPT
ncbi:hypothetical protein HY798_02405 [Candidatus Falkowbacteria bacterium]|nr:hypothetical protein [Candidatus Falkowbacteria bacterium]